MREFIRTSHRSDDPYSSKLAFGIKIVGAPQVAGTYIATLHYQMAYRVQNHSFDLSLPRDTGEALFLEIDAQSSSSCIHMPKQIPKDELVKLLPESWGDPEVGLLGEASGNFDYYVLNSKEPEEYNMMQETSYDEDFPPLEFDHDKASHAWKIKSSTKNPDRSRKKIPHAEATLYWQSENVVAQNKVLK
ncbi:hypothetical protein AgCh_024812 [Apium graveolens]